MVALEGHIANRKVTFRSYAFLVIWEVAEDKATTSSIEVGFRLRVFCGLLGKVWVEQVI